MKHYKDSRGFTIIELLTVVVVIAIIAGITVVGYSGIQNRAKDQSYLSAVDGWEKLFRMEHAITGRTPGADGVSTYCLGNSLANFPATGQFNEGECEYISGTPASVATYNQSFIDQFELKPNFPPGNLPVFNFTQGSTVVKARGIVAFIGTDGSSYEVHLYWKNNTPGSCARGTDALLSLGYPLAACERVFVLS